jgi:HSP20 family molecular chaperone IbpA
MPKTRIHAESKPVGVSPTNAADAVIEIARDAYHGHWNTLGRLSDVFIPTTLGSILRHEIPPYGRLNWGFPCPFNLCDLPRQALGTFTRSAQVSDEGDTYAVNFAVPGYEITDLDVLVNSHGITVKSNESDTDKSTRVVHSKWTSPEEIDPEGATASLDKGVLKVVVQKREDEKAQRVQITSA